MTEEIPTLPREDENMRKAFVEQVTASKILNADHALYVVLCIVLGIGITFYMTRDDKTEYYHAALLSDSEI